MATKKAATKEEGFFESWDKTIKEIAAIGKKKEPKRKFYAWKAGSMSGTTPAYTINEALIKVAKFCLIGTKFTTEGRLPEIKLKEVKKEPKKQKVTK